MHRSTVAALAAVAVGLTVGLTGGAVLAIGPILQAVVLLTAAAGR